MGLSRGGGISCCFFVLAFLSLCLVIDRCARDWHRKTAWMPSHNEEAVLFQVVACYTELIYLLISTRRRFMPADLSGFVSDFEPAQAGGPGSRHRQHYADVSSD